MEKTILKLEILFEKGVLSDTYKKEEIFDSLKLGYEIADLLNERDFSRLTEFQKVEAMMITKPINNQKLDKFFNNLKVSSLKTAWNELLEEMPVKWNNKFISDIFLKLSTILDCKTQKFEEYYRLKALKISDQSLIQIEHKADGFQIKLGSGTSGMVCKGFFKDCPAAIKKIEREDQEDDDFELEEFMKEINVMVDFASPNLIKIYGYLVSPEDFKIVMEYAELGSVANYIAKNKNKGIDLIDRIKIAKGTALGLNLLHSYNVIHRDIKSDNILLGKGLVPKLGDFGLAKKKTHIDTCPNQKTVAEDNMGVGTRAWMAPELLNSVPKYTKASDIYSLGLFFRQLSTLSTHDLREEIPEDCPPKFRELIERCCAIEPELRPKTAEIIEIIEIVEQELELELELKRKQQTSDIFLNNENPFKLDAENLIIPNEKMKPSSNEKDEAGLDIKQNIQNEANLDEGEKNCHEDSEEAEYDVVQLNNEIYEENMINQPFSEDDLWCEILSIFDNLNKESILIETSHFPAKKLLNEEMVQYICKELKLMLGLKKLVLEFGQCHNTTESVINFISDSIKCLKKLNYLSLDLSKESMFAVGVIKLLGNIQQLTELQHLELHLRETEIRDDFLIKLGNIILELKQINCLVIEFYTFDQYTNGIKVFIENIRFLRNCHKLEMRLSFMSNGLKDDHLMAIANEIKSLEALQILSIGLQHWDITEKGFSDFSKTIKELKNLKTVTIWIRDKQVSQDMIERFKADIPGSIVFKLK